MPTWSRARQRKSPTSAPNVWPTGPSTVRNAKSTARQSITTRNCWQLHGDTPQAELARERLAAIEKFPAVPTQRLAFLTTIFPDSDRSEPLETTAPADGDQPASETILR